MGKSAPKQKQSQNEKALAEVSAAKWDRYTQLYRPVEAEYIERTQQDTGSLLRARAQADIAQASAGASAGAVALGRGSATGLGATAANLGGARALGDVSATKTAQSLSDKGGLNALAIGQDMAGDAQAGLSMAARASNTEAMGRAKAQMMVNEGKMAALGSVTGALGSSYTNKTGFFAPKEGASGSGITLKLGGQG